MFRLCAKMGTGLLVLAAGATAGCSAVRRVEVLSSVPKRVEKAGRLEAIEFPSRFLVTGLQGQQLVYQVQVMDNRSRPIRSRTGAYETKSGALGASKTLFVFQSRQRTDVVAAIPAEHFSVTRDLLPLRARVELRRVSGERLASRIVVLPVSRAEEFIPPLAATTTQPASVPTPASAPASRTYWFVRPPPSAGFPVLQGPFAGRDDAAASGPAQEPLEFRADESLWFVPIVNPAEPSRMVWCGPCASEEDAREAARVLARCLLHGSGLKAGEPSARPLEAGLAERTDLGDVGSLCAKSDAP